MASIFKLDGIDGYRQKINFTFLKKCENVSFFTYFIRSLNKVTANMTPTNVLEKSLKGLSHNMDFHNVDENWQILALLSAAAGF